MKKTALLFSIAMALSACNNSADEPGIGGETRAAGFSAQIGKTASRAAGTQWAAGDAIGISGVSGSKTYTNEQYNTAAGDGNFSSAGDIIYYQTTDPVTFTAYYPYAAGLGTDGIINASTADQLQQPAFDFLWAQATGSYATPDVRFTFDHRMSRIALAFSNGNEVDLSGMTYTVEGLVADGTFDTATGVAQASGSDATSMIAPFIEESSDKATSSLIVFPQSTGTLTVNVTADGQPYRCDLPIAELVPGHNYNVNITIKKTGMTVSGCTITDWADAGTFDGDATMPMPPRRGDFFYSDGSYSTQLDLAKTCIGIVFFTPADANPDPNARTPASLYDDKVKNVDFPECSHGLVVALNDAGECNWQNTGKYAPPSVYEYFQKTGNFAPANKSDYYPIAYINTNPFNIIDYITGYQNTKILKAYNAWCINSTDPITAPVTRIHAIDLLEEFASSNQAPENTTGWYIPSPKELWVMVSKDADDIWLKRIDNAKYFIDTLIKIKEAGGDGLNRYVWSSLELHPAGGSVANFALEFPDCFNGLGKEGPTAFVRPILAF